ncbi:Appr-1-p processing protein [Agrobacterium albertimagni AOL15]|uniref:Appr-1-p processing protein n=1 Tax=Agrobacterium albertimagni AOL15 TaxID=1156935 RepID=K2QPP3_9HYPH|nr:hypothetical protein [Agrobacterium albertimagni]EKF56932.1 Appr-1-p processing protein [Agrobacterium albertimagni AOL15]
MKLAVNDTLIECLQSDVDHQSDVDALFYYYPDTREDGAAAMLVPGAVLRPGQSVIEPLPGVPGRHRIMARGPEALDDKLAAEIIKCCLENAISLCEQEYLRSVALPLTKGMITRIPVSQAAEIAAEVVVDYARRGGHLEVIRFALSSALELNTLPRHLIRAAASDPGTNSASDL